MKRVLFFTMTLVLGLAYPMQTPAGLHEHWSYDRLFKEADLVVFATALKTETARDKPPEQNWPFEFVALNTEFKIGYTLKGKADGDKLKLLHFKFGELKKGVRTIGEDVIEVIDGPSLVTFRADEAFGQDYMLFLKRRKDGRYEPLSGPFYPADSIRELASPDETKERGKGK